MLQCHGPVEQYFYQGDSHLSSRPTAPGDSNGPTHSVTVPAYTLLPSYAVTLIAGTL